MQPKGHGNVGSLAECSMLCSVMALTEMIDTVAVKKELRLGDQSRNSDSQVSNDNMH